MTHEVPQKAQEGSFLCVAEIPKHQDFVSREAEQQPWHRPSPKPHDLSWASDETVIPHGHFLYF